MKLLMKVRTVKPVLSGHSKRSKIGLQYRLLFNAGQKSILSTFIKLPFVIKILVLSIF